MKFTVKELTRFHSISVIDGDRYITIDTLHNEIFASAPGSLYPTLKLSFNKSDVLKFNKTSISTCNIDFLVYTLANCKATYNNVYSFIKYKDILHDAKSINDHAKITKAGFYNSFNENEETIKQFIEFFKYHCSSETKQQIICDHICFAHEAK